MSSAWYLIVGFMGSAIELYDRLVSETIAQLRLRLGEQALDRQLWAEIRTEFALLIEKLPDAELTKTFFSSITRQLHGTFGVAPQRQKHGSPGDCECQSAGEDSIRAARRGPSCDVATRAAAKA